MSRLATRVSTAVQRFTQRAVMPRLRDASWRGLAAAVLATLGLMIFMVRVIGAGWPERFTIFFPDSFSFKRAAKLTPFGEELIRQYRDMEAKALSVFAKPLASMEKHLARPQKSARK